MALEKTIAALNNPVRRQILVWLKDRSNFPPALPEHADLEGVCVAYIQEKAGLSQSTISNYMGLLKDAGLVISAKTMDGSLVEAIEVADHPWFIGCQFHPEFTSTPRDGHPLFSGFLDAASNFRQSNRERAAESADAD